MKSQFQRCFRPTTLSVPEASHSCPIHTNWVGSFNSQVDRTNGTQLVICETEVNMLPMLFRVSRWDGDGWWRVVRPDYLVVRWWETVRCVTTEGRKICIGTLFKPQKKTSMLHMYTPRDRPFVEHPNCDKARLSRLGVTREVSRKPFANESLGQFRPWDRSTYAFLWATTRHQGFFSFSFFFEVIMI